MPITVNSTVNTSPFFPDGKSPGARCTAPTDESGLKTLLRWVDREARAADSDKIRGFCLHAGFRRVMRRSGYFAVKSTMEFTAKVNRVELPGDYYTATDRWHVTLGDSDQDR